MAEETVSAGAYKVAEKENAKPRWEDLPDGDYALVEMMGHQTLVGRVSEAVKYGVPMLQIEPIFCGLLLPAVFRGGASLYGVTPCSKQQAFVSSPSYIGSLPRSLAITVRDEVDAQAQLPHVDEDEDEETGEFRRDAHDGEPEF